jgi:16S rRNA processing protein RimM
VADLPDPVTIGTVVGTHGVRGTVRVKPTGTGEHLREGVSPVVAGARRAIKHARPTPKGFLLDLKGVDDRRAAAALGGEAETFETAAHEVLVVRAEGGDLLVPFTLEHVPRVDLGAGRITVHPPE